MLKTVDDIELDIHLNDPRAIAIIRKIPKTERDTVIEKLIILGEMVLSHASISSRKETIEDFFSPLRSDIEMIREQLKQIVPTVLTPAKKGAMTEESIFKSLKSHFMDDAFENVSGTGKYTDLIANLENNETPILVELKDYKSTVPFKEVEKFWRDMERRGAKYGLFISMRSGISRCSTCINFKQKLDKTAIFVVNSELNWSGHLFAFYVIKKLVELETRKQKDLNGKEICKILSKINDSVLDLQKQNEMIEEIQDIADGLRTVSKRKLDELINISNDYQIKQNQKIKDILDEISKVEF
ncbi:MAG: restriction endonuclease [Candidatus Bathyarchaeota archaeon]|nr:MAG: restriction endonuclease [Candidatus Bathyarchaeota archaeon]